MANMEVNSGDAAGPSRPAARPSTQASRHHLEPNPFEQSFSSKPSGSGRSVSPETKSQGNDAKKLGHKSTKSDSGIIDGSDEGRDGTVSAGLARRSLGAAPTTPSGQSAAARRLLPPTSSLVSPAGQEQSMQYSWAPSLGSLRAGPLSPAMLAGPQHFDPSNFRTGFTPDLTNFKTGLTPLGTAGGSFPPPSPNTAAFLAMVTNGSGGGLSAAGITPNTLSALSGNPMDAPAHNPGTLQTSHALNGQQGEAPLLKFAQTNASQKKGQRSPKSKKAMANEGQAAGEFVGEHNGQHNGQQNGQPGNQTSQAASGLFLLSQAHQELAKREDAATQQQPNHHFNGDGQSLYNDAPFSQDAQPKNGKRKGSTSEPKGPGVVKKPKASKKSKAGSKMEDYSASPEMDELAMDEMPMGIGSSSNGGGSVRDDMGGDDGEEKRRDFLERNRQAALKCRQRKKAWMASLQSKVEYLEANNENLQGTIGALRNEVMFLKSQLMQAQRQLAMHGVPAPGPDPMVRHSVSGPLGGMPPGMMPTAITQVPHSNIHAMAAAAATANAPNNGNNMLAGGGGGGQYGNHNGVGPRQAHMPAQYVGPPTNKAPRQNSVQAM